MRVEFVQQCFDALAHCGATQEGNAEDAPRLLAAEIDVLCDRQILGQRQFLVDSCNPRIRRVLRRRKGDGRALDDDLSRTLTKVDLPAPLSPSSASTSPRRISRSTPASAVTAPKCLPICRATRNVSADTVVAVT
jgi:hypothetical protein